MEMPYKSLTSKNLGSLVTIIRIVTIIGYIGILVSILGGVLEMFSIDVLYLSLFAPSVYALFIAGFFAILVGLEESYRHKVEKDKSNF